MRGLDTHHGSTSMSGRPSIRISSVGTRRIGVLPFFGRYHRGMSHGGAGGYSGTAYLGIDLQEGLNSALRAARLTPTAGATAGTGLSNFTQASLTMSEAETPDDSISETYI